MDFNLTDEQQMLLESVDEFCERYFTEDVVKKMYEDHACRRRSPRLIATLVSV